MRKIAIGDIHGGYNGLEQVVKFINVVGSDILIFLGDYVDGWSESPQVIDYLLELKKFCKCVFLRGNHDTLLLEWLLGGAENKMWAEHGGEATVEAYQKVSAEVKLTHIRFLEQLDDYYIDENNRLFIHAGFTSMNGVEFEYFPKMFYWDRTLWETALAVDKTMKRSDPLFPKRLTLYKEIYIGHTPVTRIGSTVPVNKDCVWNIDTGAAFNGRVTAIEVITKKFWQSDPLPSLYPGESGRNK
jgi:serine/threonine protein phosphatase 1